MMMPPSSAAGEDDPCSSSGGFQTDTIEDALASFRKGECLLVLDDCDRENEGDLVVSAAAISTQLMAWIIKHSSGYVCIALPGERLDELEIPLMIEANTEKHKTAYTHTVDYKYNTSTGISAHDRALTAMKLSDRTSRAEDFTRPGHMVPLRAREGGVLARRGHTEAAIDLCKLAGLPPAGVICELVKPDCPLGSMARRDDCHRFARQWKLKIITIEDLVQYIRKLDHPPSPPKPSTPSSHVP